jgi:hypothetical protein
MVIVKLGNHDNSARIHSKQEEMYGKDELLGSLLR